MRYLARLFCLFLCAITASQAAAQVDPAADGPVVVELFTSQGCSACPPADELLADLARRDGVIALSLHVDYWDYIGWADSFAAPAFTVRQKRYAEAAGRKMIYTPQMVVGGHAAIVGHDAVEVMDAVMAEQEAEPVVQIETRGSGSDVVVDLRPLKPLPAPAVVQLVRYLPSARVEVHRGENAGRVLRYTNVVTGWTDVATWEGKGPTRLNLSVEGVEPAVILVQRQGQRRMLAAARAR